MVTNLTRVSEVKVIYRPKFNASLRPSSIFLAHNHPSGNINASTADNQVTNRIKRAGELLELKVYDHLIITKGGFYSYSDDGLL